MKRTVIYLLLITILGFSFNGYAQEVLSQEDILKNVDQYIEKVQNEWKIPGMAVAIIKDNKVIHAKGFGLKDLSKPDDKVDPNTIFQIGSISKSFTAAVMAQLVDQNLVKWEDTVKNILPDFEMYDPWVTANMQVKDLMTHRTGLAGQSGTYIPNLGYDRDDIYNMLKYIKPVYSFRGDYQYNNITFIVAAKIIEKLTGMSWEENVQQRIFDKLGMTSSSVDGEGFLASENVALPYEFLDKDGEMVINPLYGDEQALWWLTVIGPAGAVNSSANDLIKWAQFHLNMGKVGDEQIISEKNMKYLHKGITITSQNENRTTIYGQCWFIEQTKKGRLYFHTGTTWGMTAICCYFPELNLGMVILVNSEAPSEPRYAIMRRTLDLFLGEPDKDYSQEYLAEWYESSKKSAEKKEKKDAEIINIPAPKAKALVGKYTKEALFGDAWVTLEKGKLFIKAGKQGFKREMVHVNGNKYNFRCDGHGFDITFTMNESGKKATSFEIDFGGGEDFGPWTRISK